MVRHEKILLLAKLMHVYVSRGRAMAAHWFLPFLLWFTVSCRQIEAFLRTETSGMGQG